MKLKTFSFLLASIYIVTAVSCHDKISTGTKDNNPDSTLNQSDTSSTSKQVVKNENGESDCQLDVPIQVRAVSKNLKDLVDLFERHDASSAKKTTFIGFDFTSNTQPLSFSGLLFETDPKYMDENATPYQPPIIMDPENFISTINACTGTQPITKRRLVLKVQLFNQLIQNLRNTANLRDFKIKVVPDSSPVEDCYGFYIPALMVVAKVTNDQTVAVANLHPCPKCSSSIKLIDFVKQRM